MPLVAFLAFVAGSCAGVDRGPVKHPAGANEVILRVESRGVGLMHPAEVMNPRSPKLTLFGDGRLIVDQAEEGSRFVTTFAVARLSEAGIQRLLDAALEAGLRAEGGRLDAAAGSDGDPTIYVTLVVSGTAHITSAWHLDGTGPDEEGLDEEILRRREALRRFLSRLDDLPGLLGGEMVSGLESFEPGRWVAAWAVVRDPEGDGPWSSDMLADFRVRPWPLAPLAPLAGLGEPFGGDQAIQCALVEGEDAEALRASLDEYTLWESDGVVYYLYARPLLPDEEPCSVVLS